MVSPGHGFGFVDVDHVPVGVDDLEESVTAFQRLGFTIAPPRRREDPAALRPTETRHILFQPARDDIANFIALQHVAHPTALSDDLARVFSFLGDSQGVKSIVAYAPDIEHSKALLTAAKIATSDAHEHSEGWWHDGEAGIDLPIRVRQLALLGRHLPLSINGFQTSSLPHWRHSPWTSHENSAIRLSGVIAVSRNAEGDASSVAHAFGVEHEETAPGRFEVTPRDVTVTVLSPDAFSREFGAVSRSSEQILPGYVGVTVEVASVEQASAVLDRNGVEHQRPDPSRILIPRHHAANTIVELREAGTLEKVAAP
jgi:hypothetical protein